MIKENGVWKCDYCDRESGEYYRETGNHVDCQDRAKSIEIERLRAENTRLAEALWDIAAAGGRKTNISGWMQNRARAALKGCEHAN